MNKIQSNLIKLLGIYSFNTDVFVFNSPGKTLKVSDTRHVCNF